MKEPFDQSLSVVELLRKELDTNFISAKCCSIAFAVIPRLSRAIAHQSRE